jgi:hypothetical protein
MKLELRSTLNAVRDLTAEISENIKRKHRLRKEKKVKERLSESFDISEKNIKKYRDELRTDATNSVLGRFPLIFGGVYNIIYTPLALQQELERIDDLTPQQLKEKISKIAQKKTEK